MAGEIWLIIASGCAACAVLVAIRWAWRPAKYTGRHTAEQPAVKAAVKPARKPREHVGATEDWSPTAEYARVVIPPLDPKVRLREALAALARAQDEVDAAQLAVLRAEETRTTDTLDALQSRFRDQLARAGQDLMTTHEWRRGDISRIIRDPKRKARALASNRRSPTP